MLRSVLAVVAGYLVFAVSAALLFAVSGHDPRTTPSTSFAVGSIAYGILFGAVAGYVAGRLAPKKPLLHAICVGAVIEAVALLSLIAQFRAGSVWSQLAAILLMAPATLIGGAVATRAVRE